jgi:hypothetical protein
MPHPPIPFARPATHASGPAAERASAAWPIFWGTRYIAALERPQMTHSNLSACRRLSGCEISPVDMNAPIQHLLAERDAPGENT